MAIVVEGDKVTIIFINAGSGDDGTSKITTDILSHNFGVASVRFGVNIKSFFMIFVAGSLNLLERRTDFRLHFIQKSSAKSITKVSVVKVMHIAPKPIIAVSTFRDEAMDVRVPLEISAKGMKNHDKTRGKVF